MIGCSGYHRLPLRSSVVCQPGGPPCILPSPQWLRFAWLRLPGVRVSLDWTGQSKWLIASRHLLNDFGFYRFACASSDRSDRIASVRFGRHRGHAIPLLNGSIRLHSTHRDSMALCPPPTAPCSARNERRRMPVPGFRSPRILSYRSHLSAPPSGSIWRPWYCSQGIGLVLNGAPLHSPCSERTAMIWS
jgi:hypothetical protein